MRGTELHSHHALLFACFVVAERSVASMPETKDACC